MSKVSKFFQFLFNEIQSILLFIMIHWDLTFSSLVCINFIEQKIFFFSCEINAPIRVLIYWPIISSPINHKNMKTIFVVILSLIIGSIVNISLIIASPHLITPPPGVDYTNFKSIQDNIHLHETKHFIVPFLAHALGTLVGSIVATALAGGNSTYFVGGIFLLGGIVNVFSIPAPMWFNVLDLVVAYIPMSFLASKLFGSKTKLT